MVGSGVPVGWCKEVIGNGYCLVDYLVKECEACDCPACVERLQGVGLVVEGEAGCSPLDFFQFVYVRFCVGVPGWGHILNGV